MVTFSITRRPPNPVFKVTTFLEIEYLKNGAYWCVGLWLLYVSSCFHVTLV